MPVNGSESSSNAELVRRWLKQLDALNAQQSNVINDGSIGNNQTPSDLGNASQTQQAPQQAPSTYTQADIADSKNKADQFNNLFSGLSYLSQQQAQPTIPNAPQVDIHSNFNPANQASAQLAELTRAENAVLIHDTANDQNKNFSNPNSAGAVGAEFARDAQRQPNNGVSVDSSRAAALDNARPQSFVRHMQSSFTLSV